MRDKVTYKADEYKKLYFDIHGGAHAELVLKLRYDRLSQHAFFSKLVRAYLDDNKIMRELIKDINKEKMSKKTLKIMKKDEELAEKTVKDFGLNEDEIEDIFDQIEYGEEDDL